MILKKLWLVCICLHIIKPIQEDNFSFLSQHLRKKTENRRLDYDCKKRKKSAGSAITEEELTQATEKFEESRVQTQTAMNHLLNNEVEHITHLAGFAEGFLEYHHQCYEILKDMVKQLNDK
jgi:endophilin-A